MRMSLGPNWGWSSTRGFYFLPDSFRMMGNITIKQKQKAKMMQLFFSHVSLFVSKRLRNLTLPKNTTIA